MSQLAIETAEQDFLQIHEKLKQLSLSLEEIKARVNICRVGEQPHWAGWAIEAEKLSTVQEHQVAIEELSNGILAMIVAGVLAAIAIIAKCINWARSGGKSSGDGGGFTGSKSQMHAVNDLMRDQQLRQANEDVSRLMDDMVRQQNQQTHNINQQMHHAMHALHATESYNGDNIQAIFSHYRESLTEQELDFLTTGERYNVTRNSIIIFTNGRFSDYIKSLSSDVEAWTEKAIMDAPFVGKNEEPVADFVREKRKEIDNINVKYLIHAADIDEMERQCKEHKAFGNPQQLHVFQDKPSRLIPHLETVWKKSEFEKISEEDRRLIANLDSIKDNFERTYKLMKARSEKRERPWPAEEAVLHLADKMRREIISQIVGLVRVGGFIRHSAETAFHATTKSFAYIVKILNVLSKMDNVDQEQVIKCLDTMREKQKEFHAIAKIA